MFGSIPGSHNKSRIRRLKQEGTQLVLWSAGPMPTPLASKIPVYGYIRGLQQEHVLPYSGWFKWLAHGAAQKHTVPVVCCAALSAGFAYSQHGSELAAEYDEKACVGDTGYTGRARLQMWKCSYA